MHCFRFAFILLAVAFTTAESPAAPASASGPTKPEELFAMSNLHAWCVPSFDAKKRGIGLIGITSVGMIYNFSHGLGDIARFPALWKRINPYVVAVNVSSMVENGEGKLMPPSQGKHELAMLRVILDSGWRGPVGVIAEQGGDAEVTLDASRINSASVRLWFPERSPYRCAITENGAHSGRHALMIENCFRARFSQNAPAESGARYRVGLWFRQTEGAGSYRFSVDARLADGTYPVLANAPITGKPAQWREFVTEVAAPPSATRLMLRLYVDGQAADARCWINDVFIGTYPKQN